MRLVRGTRLTSLTFAQGSLAQANANGRVNYAACPHHCATEHRQQRCFASSSRSAWREDASSAKGSKSRSKYEVLMPSASRVQRRPVDTTVSIDALRQDNVNLNAFSEALRSKALPTANQAWLQLCQTQKKHILTNDELRSFLDLICESNEETIILDFVKEIPRDRPEMYLHICEKLYGQERYQLMLDTLRDTLSVGSTLENAHRDVSRLHQLPQEHFNALIALACLAACRLPGKPWDRIISSLCPWGSPLKGTQRSLSDYGKPISTAQTDLLLPVKVPKLIKEQLAHDSTAHSTARKAYRHFRLAFNMGRFLALGYEKASNQPGMFLSRLIRLRQFDEVEQALIVFEEAHTDWMDTTFTHTTSERKCCWSLGTWRVLLHDLITSNQTTLAQQAWQMFLRCKPENVAVNPIIWTALLSAYGEIADWDRVSQVWQLATQSMKPDDYMITSMISSLFRARQPFEAMLMFEQLKQQCASRKAQLQPATMNALLHGLSLNDRIDEAAKIVTQMARQVDATLPLPNIETINTMLRAYGRHGNVKSITDVLQLMVDLELQPDTVTFTTVLDALSRMGLGDSVERVYELMQSLNVGINAVTMTALIKQYILNDGRAQPQLGKAFSLLDMMESQGPVPTAVTYTDIMSCLLRDVNAAAAFLQQRKQNTLPARYNLKSAERILARYDVDVGLLTQQCPSIVLSLLMLERMKQLRVRPNRKTYHTLIGGLLHRRQMDADGIVNADQAMQEQIMKQMIRLTLRLLDTMTEPSAPNDRTLTVILDSLRHFTRAEYGAIASEALALVHRLASLAEKDENLQVRLVRINGLQKQFFDLMQSHKLGNET